mmetsp:Transcript_137656/g.383971  ORF Transcript_137656/g.383971 Transcript_137656/m.383971 type:complete len:295 (-) Transcript_137656:210-1094(-)
MEILKDWRFADSARDRPTQPSESPCLDCRSPRAERGVRSAVSFSLSRSFSLVSLSLSAPLAPCPRMGHDSAARFSAGGASCGSTAAEQTSTFRPCGGSDDVTSPVTVVGAVTVADAAACTCATRTASWSVAAPNRERASVPEQGTFGCGAGGSRSRVGAGGNALAACGPAKRAARDSYSSASWPSRRRRPSPWHANTGEAAAGRAAEAVAAPVVSAANTGWGACRCGCSCGGDTAQAAAKATPAGTLPVCRPGRLCKVTSKIRLSAKSVTRVAGGSKISSKLGAPSSKSNSGNH